MFSGPIQIQTWNQGIPSGYAISRGVGVASQLARQLGPRRGVWLVNWVLEGGHWGVYPILHTKNMPYRLDKVALCFSRGATKKNILIKWAKLVQYSFAKTTKGQVTIIS